jgi:hypothetical protein
VPAERDDAKVTLMTRQLQGKMVSEMSHVLRGLLDLEREEKVEGQKNCQDQKAQSPSGQHADVNKLTELALSLHMAIINDAASPGKNKPALGSIDDLVARLAPAESIARNMHAELEHLRKKVKDFELRQQYKELKGDERQLFQSEVEKLRNAAKEKQAELEKLQSRAAEAQASGKAELEKFRKALKDRQTENEKLRGDLVGTAVSLCLPSKRLCVERRIAHCCIQLVYLFLGRPACHSLV